jgi:hypothetical protein
MVHSMLTTKHLSNEYWVEAVASVLYILNRCPTKSVKNRIPQGAWIGSNHNVAHLRVFGFIAYAHVPEELRRKLTTKDKNVYLLGILKRQKDTRCMTLSQEKS